MKKIYKNPTLKVVEIQPANIIAGSPDPKFSSSSKTATMDTRRGGSFWDDDEE